MIDRFSKLLKEYAQGIKRWLFHVLYWCLFFRQHSLHFQLWLIRRFRWIEKMKNLENLENANNLISSVFRRKERSRFYAGAPAQVTKKETRTVVAAVDLNRWVEVIKSIRELVAPQYSRILPVGPWQPVKMMTSSREALLLSTSCDFKNFLGNWIFYCFPEATARRY